MDAVRRMGKDVYLNTSETVDVGRKKSFTASVKKYINFFRLFLKNP